MLKPRFSSLRPIERGFRRLAHGDVHFRAAGEGPVVLALHESPRSSLSLIPVIDALSAHYRVIAPDTPGYGLSDPLAQDAPKMDDFLDALAGLLDAFSVQKVALYGAHTGAALATAFALRWPERVTALALDGFSSFTPEEVEAFHTRYLVPYAPCWDGRHVMGLWSRVKDLYTWFPWYDRTAERRLRTDPDGLELLHRSALGFLQAGAHYAKAYRIAAAFQPNAVMQDLKSPTTVIARPDDLIADHLHRLTPGPNWDIRWLDPTDASWRLALMDALGKGDRPDQMPPGHERVPSEGSVFLPLGDGWLHAKLKGPADGAVRVLLPGLPSDLDALIAREAARYPSARIVALTLPGCGWSDPLADGAVGLEQIFDGLDAALLHLNLEPATVAGQGASGVIAKLWGRRRAGLVAEQIDPLAWMGPDAPLPAPLLVRRSPGWDGAHVTSAWFQLRDLRLYDTPPGAGRPVRRVEPDPSDLADLDRLFRAYMEGPDCADLLEMVVDHVRRYPESRRHPPPAQ